MGCDKRYGLRQIWIAAESAQCVPATFTADNWLATTGSTFPAMYRNQLDNNESLPGRGQSASLDGAQNELAFDITLNLPRLADDEGLSAAGLKPYALLWWALGSNGNDPADCAERITMGDDGDAHIAIQSYTTCGRTLCVAGLDRDGINLEILQGCVISQAVINLSTTEQPTIVFSGVASRKVEVIQEAKTTAPTAGSNAWACRTSFGLTTEVASAYFSGVYLVAPSGETTPIKNFDGGHINIAAWGTAPETVSGLYTFALSMPSSIPTISRVTTADWAISGVAANTATVTIEGGNHYGELTTAAQYPTEMLSGQAKVSGSFSAYLTDEVIKMADVTSDLLITLGDSKDNIILSKIKFTERPQLDLSSVDDAATGEFSFGAFGSNDGRGNLSTIYFGEVV